MIVGNMERKRGAGTPNSLGKAIRWGFGVRFVVGERRFITRLT